MTIVRSLLVAVGFKTDDSGIKKTEKNILGMTARIGASFTVLKFFAKRVVGFFSDIADSIINTSFLAKRLGVDLKDIASLEKAGIEFGVNKKSIQDLLLTTQKLINDQKLGINADLQTLARVRSFEIEANENAITLLFKILKSYENISNDQDRIRISEKTFANVSANFILELSKNIDDFKKVFEENKLNDTVLGDEKNALDFKKSLDKLSDSFDKILELLSVTLFPLLTNLFDAITFFTDTVRALFNPNLNRLKNVGERFAKSGFLGEATQSFGTGLSSGLFDVNDKFNAINPSVTVNNEINLPEGTSSEMAKNLLDDFVKTVDDGINKVFKQIANDNPLVE